MGAAGAGTALTGGIYTGLLYGYGAYKGLYGPGQIPMHSALAWLKNPDTSSEPKTKDPATDRARFTQPETTENPALNRLTAPKGGHWLIAGESLMNIIGGSFMKVPRLITPARGLHPRAGSTGQEITQDRQQIAAPKSRSISLHTHAPKQAAAELHMQCIH